MEQISKSEEESEQWKKGISEKQWYKYNFIDAMRFGYEKYRESESKHGTHSNVGTTLMVPQLVLTTVGKVRREFPSFSIRYILYQLIKHGFSIMQNEYNTDIKRLDSMRAPLELAELVILRTFLSKVHVVVNGLKDPNKQNIVTAMYVSIALSDWSRILCTEHASLMRLCMYYSVATIDLPEIVSKVIPTAEKEIAAFRVHVADLDAIYQGFTLAESIKVRDRRADGK